VPELEGLDHAGLLNSERFAGGGLPVSSFTTNLAIILSVIED